VANLLRFAFLMVSGIAIALGVAVQQPGWAHQMGFQGQWGEDDQLYYPADETNHLIVQRIHEKNRVTEELLDGRLTLFEAAAIFLRLDQQPPTILCHPQYVGLPKEEAACRQVIEWARQRMDDRSPDAAEQFVKHLEEQLRRQKEQDKPLCI
jgi:hypothetical protein